MKKLKSTCTNMALVLTLIAVIAGAVLALANKATSDQIAKNASEKEANAIAEVLGGGEVTPADPVEVSVQGSTYVIYDCGEKGVAVKAVDPQNASFGGDLTVMVGYDTNGQVLGYTILKTNETPGLGAKAADHFQKGGKGCVIGKTAGQLTVSKDGGDVDAITASTITSRAFLRAVNTGYEAYKKSLEANNSNVEE